MDSELKSYLEFLESDYNSCSKPDWTDMQTQKTLRKISKFIRNGKYTLEEFISFAHERLKGEFGEGCIKTIIKLI
jgi:hypothetical protein